MKRIALIILIASFFTGCVAGHNPYAHVGASKTINIGGVDVGVGIGDFINLGL